MSESPPLPGPASPAPAPVAAPAPSPTEALATLQGDKQWSADFNGDNGRIAQKKAAERKSALLRGDQPDTGPAVPDHIRETLDDGAAPGRVEAYIPASDPSEYKFQFNEAESFEAAQEMSTVAREAAFAVGANAEFAQATVKHVAERLGRVAPGMSVAENEGSLDMAVARLAGAEAGATIADATEAVMAMPEAGRKWVQNTLKALDPDTAAWFTARLARTHRANRP